MFLCSSLIWIGSDLYMLVLVSMVFEFLMIHWHKVVIFQTVGFCGVPVLALH